MKPYPHYCWIAPILTVIFLVGCNQKGEVPVTGLIDQSGTDSTVRPQDDFFNYANQSWIKKTEIPPSQFAWGAFMTIRDQALNNLRTILDSLTNAKDLGKNTAGQRVADLYSSIMDSTMIESKGLSSLKEDMDHINAIKDVPGLLDEVARENTEGINVLFDMSVGPDDKNSLKNMVQFNQGGMGLPTKDYYFKQDSSIKKVRDAYLTYIAKIFSITGATPTEASQKAAQVLDAETALAKVSRDPVALRDPITNYHKLSVGQCNALTPGMDWTDFLGKLCIKTDSVLIGQPAFFTGMAKALTSVPLGAWKSYLILHVFYNYASVLDHEVVDASFAFTQAITGLKQQRPRWKRATTLVDRYLGDDLGQMYVNNYFPPQAKMRIQQLVDNMQAT